MACKNIKSKLLSYIYGVLDEQERTAVEAHLKLCPECHQESVIIRSTLQRLKRGAVHEPMPPGAKERMREEIRRKVG